MKKIFKHEGNTYEGIFILLPGKQNYGHLMIDGAILYGKTEDDKQGEAVEFGCGKDDEVVIVSTESFAGFFNLNVDAKIIPQKEETKVVAKTTKPIKLNNREEIQTMSKDAEEMLTAMRQHAVDNIVFIKEVKDVNPNKLYGHLVNLEKAKYIERLGKDKKRGTKIKILK